MKFIIFNVLLFLLILIFLESREVKDYLSYHERQCLLFANILISNILYFIGIELVYIYILGILSGSAYIDCKYREIPNRATLLSLFVVLIYCFFNMVSINVIDMAIGLIIYLIFMLSCLLGYIGGGDIKIFLPLVILMGGINFTVFILIIGIMVIIREFINVIYTKKINLKREIALAPYFYMSMVSVSILINS